MKSQERSENQVFELPQFQRCIQALKRIDFELAYLALLTYKGIKPLSRWEKTLDDKGLQSLQGMDLVVKQITKTVKTGGHVVETLFSRLPAYIQLYEQHFANQPLDKSIETQRFEGYLFGYPSCCVEQFIRRPYAENNLPENEQKILFHWACSDCRITPVLLEAYKNVYKLLDNL